MLVTAAPAPDNRLTADREQLGVVAADPDGASTPTRTSYPVETQGVGTSSTSDYEELACDAAGNVATRRLRDGQSIAYGYDALDRLVVKTPPTGMRPVHAAYDLLGRLTAARFDSASGTDAVTMAYDALGRRTEINRASSYTGYSYDAAGRLAGLTQRFAGGTGNGSASLTWNPAGQIASRTEANDAFAWTGAANAGVGYTANGRNQYASAGGAAPTYDGRGNLTGYGGATWSYDAESRLKTASTSGGTTLTYDPFGRLWRIASPVREKTDFVFDGAHVAVEYDGDTGGIRRRFFWGPGAACPRESGGAGAAGRGRGDELLGHPRAPRRRTRLDRRGGALDIRPVAAICPPAARRSAGGLPS